MTDRSISVFIPAYNEEDTIGTIINNIKQLNHKISSQNVFKVYVIDDGSIDKTFENALNAGAIVVRHPINLGGGAAIRTAFSIALLENDDYIVTLDADCQHDPQELPRMLQYIDEDVGLVIGSRFLNNHNLSMKGYRQYGIKFFSNLVSNIIGKRVTDVTSGFRIYNTKEVRKVFSEIRENQYYAIEILMHITRHSKVIEVPIKDINRVKGKSKKGVLKYFYHLFRVFLKGSFLFLSSSSRTVSR